MSAEGQTIREALEIARATIDPTRSFESASDQGKLARVALALEARLAEAERALREDKVLPSIDGTQPVALRVREFTPEGHATQLFGIVADYGWCEAIWFADAYEDVARVIHAVLSAALPSESGTS